MAINPLFQTRHRDCIARCIVETHTRDALIHALLKAFEENPRYDSDRFIETLDEQRTQAMHAKTFDAQNGWC